MAALQSLIKQVNGDTQAQQDLINDYLTESDHILVLLTDAVAAHDERHIKALSHTWRSTSALLGAAPLAALLERMEHHTDQAPSDRQHLAQAIEAEYTEARRILTHLQTTPLNDSAS